MLPAALRIAVVTATAVVLSFGLVLLAPGEVQVGAESARPTSAAAEAMQRERAGVSETPWVRLRQHAQRLMVLDLGRSTVDNRPVSAILREAAPRSALLTGSALTLALALGLVVGTARAWRPAARGWRVIAAVLTAVYALPELVVGVGLLALFTRLVPWLPPGGISDPIVELTGSASARALDRLLHLVLPATTLAFAWCAAILRQQYAATREAATSAHVQTARAKGMCEPDILARDVLWLTAPSVCTVLGTMMPVLLAGAVLVESLFGWPGLGQVMVQAVTARDAPVVAGATLLVAVLTVTATVVAELLARCVDPRLRHA